MKLGNRDDVFRLEERIKAFSEADFQLREARGACNEAAHALRAREQSVKWATVAYEEARNDLWAILDDLRKSSDTGDGEKVLLGDSDSDGDEAAKGEAV